MALVDEVRSLRERSGASFSEVPRALVQDEIHLAEEEARTVTEQFC